MNLDSSFQKLKEEKRLENLYEYKILDAFVGPEMHALTKVASLICHVPICLISIVDKDRILIKAKTGLEIEEMSRCNSFCEYAIHQDMVLSVNDTLDDDRFSKNPMVLNGPKIRFYIEKF